MFFKNRRFGCIFSGLFAGTILFIFFIIVLLRQFFDMIDRGVMEEEPFLFKVIEETPLKVILGICCLLLPIIIISVGHFKGARLTVKNRPWLYFCIGFSLFSIFRFLESIKTFSLINTSICLLIPYYSLEAGSCILIMISLLCGYKLTTKERLKKLRIPIILILVGLIIGVADSIYHRIVILKNFRILSILFFTRMTFLLSGCAWRLKVATKLLRGSNESNGVNP